MRIYLRNIRYAARHPVRTYKVRKACRAQVRAHPVCAWCGGTTSVEAHHIIPLWRDESLGADARNFVSLCRRRRCHLLVGHNGNFGGRYVENVAQVCAIKRVVHRAGDTMLPEGAAVCAC